MTETEQREEEGEEEKQEEEGEGQREGVVRGKERIVEVSFSENSSIFGVPSL